MRLHHCKTHIAIINNIIKDPDVYDMIYDDHSKESFKQNLGEAFLSNNQYVMLNPCKGCLFMLTPSTFTLFELHTMIRKEARGRNAINAARDATSWLFKNTTCEKIITHIPKYNKQAKVFARMCNFELIGINTKSFKRDGVLHDQYVYGLEKEKFLCQL